MNPFEGAKPEDIKVVGRDVEQPAAEPNNPEKVETKVEPTPVEAPKTESSFTDFNTFLKEKSGGEFEDLEVLLNELKQKREAQPVQEVQWKDDYIKKVVEYYNEKGSLEDYLKAYSVDYEKLPATEIMKMQLKESHPNLSDKALDALYRKEVLENPKYGLTLSEDVDDPADIELGKELLNSEADKFRKALIEKQRQLTSLPEKKETKEPTKEELQAQWQEYVAEAKKKLSEMPETQSLVNDKRVVVEYDGKKFAWEIEDPEEFIDTAIDADKFFAQFRGADGKEDYGKFYKVVAYAKDPAAFEQALINYGKSLGSESFIEKELKNPSKTDEPGVPNSMTESEWKQGFLKALQEQAGRR